MLSARNFGLEVVSTSGGEELVRCPFHDDKKPSAWFNPQKELFWCAVCQVGLNVFQLEQRLGVSLDLADMVPTPPDYDLTVDSEPIPRGVSFYHDYIAARGIEIATAQKYRVEWILNNPEAAVLPVCDLKNYRVGSILRYANPGFTGTRYKKFGRMFPLWPMPMLLEAVPGDYVIVTEGPWSAMRMWQVGMGLGGCGVVLSTMGARATPSIVDMLRPFNPIFLYDNDTAGRLAAQKMRMLAPLWHSYTLQVAPDDRSDREVELIIESIGEKLST